MENTRDTKSILEMARGAIMERVDYEMARVIENVLDQNTKPTAKRKVTINIEITPDDAREILTVNTTAKSTLAPTNPVTTALFLGEQNGEVCAVEMTPQTPYQQSLFDKEQEAPAVLNIVKPA